MSEGRCEVCNRPGGLLATTLRVTGVVGERRVVDHCDRLVRRVAAAEPKLWNPGDIQYWERHDREGSADSE